MAAPRIEAPTDTINNPDLALMIDYDLAFASFGLTSHVQVGPGSVTSADVSGTVRASGVADLVSGAPAFSQGTDARKPAYVADGGPGGLTGALLFDRARGDRMDWSGTGPTGKHTIVEVIKPVLTEDTAIDMNLFSADNSGSSGKNLFQLRQQTLTAMLVKAYFGATGTESAPSASITPGAWQVVLRTWDPATRIGAVGVLAPGASTISWVADTAEEGATVTATAFGLGARANFADAYNGYWAGRLTFTGHDARTDADLSDAIIAWAAGSDSVFGL